MLSLIFLLVAADCKTVLLKKDEIAPCSGYLVSQPAAEKAFDIVENLYPKAQVKVELLEKKALLLADELKIDTDLINSFKQEIVIYKKDIKELMDFSKKSLLEYDKQAKLQTIIVVVSVGVTIVLVVGAVLAVGYLAHSFAR